MYDHLRVRAQRQRLSAAELPAFGEVHASVDAWNGAVCSFGCRARACLRAHMRASVVRTRAHAVRMGGSTGGGRARAGDAARHAHTVEHVQFALPREGVAAPDDGDGDGDGGHEQSCANSRHLLPGSRACSPACPWKQWPESVL